MKYALLAAAPLLLAMQDPKPAKNSDPHICDVIYNANEVTNVTAIMGREVTIRFSDKDQIQKVTVSDSSRMKFSVLPHEGGNFLSLKATDRMDAQPIMVVATTTDGTQRYYTLQWTALDDAAPLPNPAAIASNDPVPLVVRPLPQTCYTIRYQYPGEVRAAQAAQWQARAAQQRAQQAEVALHQQSTVRPLHAWYGQGDAMLQPAAIFDDGYSTELDFGPGRKIPVMLTVTTEGKEAEIAGMTTLDNGVVIVHDVPSLIRLRDGDLVLCMMPYSRTPSTDPQTGTTSPNIVREPYVK